MRVTSSTMLMSEMLINITVLRNNTSSPNLLAVWCDFYVVAGRFCYLNSLCVRKSITLEFMSSSRDEFTLSHQNLVIDVSVGFQPPCWCPSAWRLLTKLYKFRYNIFWISLLKDCTDLNLGKVQGSIFTFFHFLDSGLKLLNGFVFDFWWRDSDNQQYT